jgi:hypothetical protein
MHKASSKRLTTKKKEGGGGERNFAKFTKPGNTVDSLNARELLKIASGLGSKKV